MPLFGIFPSIREYHYNDWSSGYTYYPEAHVRYPMGIEMGTVAPEDWQRFMGKRVPDAVKLTPPAEPEKQPVAPPPSAEPQPTSSITAPSTSALGERHEAYHYENKPETNAPPTDVLNYLAERRKGSGVNIADLHPEMATRLAKALKDAEAATGEKAAISSAHRSSEQQAEAYARFLRGEIALAAPPGMSRHEKGKAVDIMPGKVLDWLHQNADRYGLEFLKGHAFKKDPVHLQMKEAMEAATPPKPAAPVAGKPAASAPKEPLVRKLLAPWILRKQ